jgi:hypothetical protein
MLSVAAAGYIAAFAKRMQRHPTWSLSDAFCNPYWWPFLGFAVAQAALVGFSVVRTYQLRAGSRIMRHGPDSVAP